MASFYTLEGAARLYAAVMDLWLHYREVLDLRYLEYRYEDLVAAPEETARAVIAFMGEAWSDEVLDYRRAAAERYVATPSRQAVAEPLTDRAIGPLARLPRAPRAGVAGARAVRTGVRLRGVAAGQTAIFAAGTSSPSAAMAFSSAAVCASSSGCTGRRQGPTGRPERLVAALAAAL